MNKSRKYEIINPKTGLVNQQSSLENFTAQGIYHTLAKKLYFCANRILTNTTW